MAESKTVALVPLNNSNYSTWKIQCKMALIKEGLWGIVNGTETVPEEGAERAKFISRRDKALATIVLAVDPKLLYLIGGDPEDPVVVWRALVSTKHLGQQARAEAEAVLLEVSRWWFSTGPYQDHD